MAFTINPVTGELQKIFDDTSLSAKADKNESRSISNAFKIAILGDYAKFEVEDGFVDEYEDESGIDTVASINQLYDQSGDYYEPSVQGGIDAYVKLLLSLDADFTDSSASAHTVTANGNAHIDTSIKKFGAGSCNYDGAGDYLSIGVAPSDDFSFGTGDFTIDFWVYRNGNINDYGGVFSTTNGTSEGWVAYFGNAGTGTANIMKFATASGGWGDKVTSDTIIPDQTWTHIAIVRNGASLKMYQAGVEVDSADITGFNIEDGASAPVSGRIWTAQAGMNFKGNIDELRISKGIARWTTAFTPPISAYDNEKSNMTLISLATVATSAPTSAKVYILKEDITAIELNTDLKAYVSRDDGTTWTPVNLAFDSNFNSTTDMIVGSADISAQPSDTDMLYKIETLNNKDIKIHATAELW